MDYAELQRKMEYTEMVIPEHNPGYTTVGDLVNDELDLQHYGLKVLADRRPDPRNLEIDQKQTNTDSVAFLRQRYSNGYGLRTGDVPENYHSELFLEDTEKDPRRSFVDPDFREAIKQTYGRQKMLIRNLYPEDPSSGQITMGQKDQKGLTMDVLNGRAQSEGRYRSLLQDQLDGTEPRRVFRYDNYSYIDKALANQGDLPYIWHASAESNVPMHPMASPPGGPIVGWTNGELVFQVAKLGRSASAHIDGTTQIKMRDAQRHKADITGKETGRNEAMTDQNKLYAAPTISALNDTIRKVVEGSIRAESQNARAANRGMEWGSIQEDVRGAMNKIVEQIQMQQQADVQNNKGIRGSTVRVDGGAAALLATQTTETARNLLNQFKDLFNRANLPMSSIAGNTVTSENIKQEVNNINENWRMELSAGVKKARASLMDDIQSLAASTHTQAPWYEVTGRNLEVANYRSKPKTDMKRVNNYTVSQSSGANLANDTFGSAAGVGRASGDTNSLIYAANTGAQFYPEFAAASGSMAGVSGGLTTKQKVRFNTAENGDWIADTMAVGEVTGRGGAAPPPLKPHPAF
jgi:hypothetical protein